MNENLINEGRLEEFENKLTEIRKLSLGTLLLAKELWKDTLVQRKEGTEVIRITEEAEDAFVDNSLTDTFERYENTLNVIYKRVKGLFFLLEDMLRNEQKTK